MPVAIAPAPPHRHERPDRPEPYRWSRAVYEQAVLAGVFDSGPDEWAGPRVELLDGEIIDMPPLSPLHVTALGRAVRVIGNALAALPVGHVHLRTQAPLALDDRSEPEPDLAIVRGDLDDYAEAHPTSALLVVEVSSSTLIYDRTRKAAAYARNGIPEYWIINLNERAVEVMRDPTADGYRFGAVFAADERVQSSVLPPVDLAVADLLP